VLTPSAFYTNCLLRTLRDVSGGGSSGRMKSNCQVCWA
jgi:hypothetical protein